MRYVHLVKPVFAWMVVVIFGIGGILAYFHPGLWTAHDIWHQVARFYWYTQALHDGQVLPGWIMSLANGYGYPLFIFSYHLPWLAGYPLLLFGISLENALKILFGGSFIVSGFCMYAFLHDWLQQRLPAVVGAIVYLWAPYHFLTLYVTAAIGTGFAFMLVPLIFWGLYRLTRFGWDRGGVVLLALSTAGLALCHLMTLVMLVPVLALWAVGLMLEMKRFNLKPLAAAGGLAMGLTAVYLLPMAAYLPLIKANQPGNGFTGMYQNFFPSLKQLVYSRWGYGPIISNAKDGEISLQIGVAQWLAIALLAAITVYRGLKKRSSCREGLVLCLFGVTVWLLTDSSKVWWDQVNRITTLDYPFRLLLMAVLIGSMATALLLTLIKPLGLRIILSFGLVGIALYTNRNHIRVNQYTEIPVADYVAAEITTNTFNEYLPLGASDLTRKPYRLIAGNPGLGLLHSRTTRSLSFSVTASESASYSLGQYAFPGIVATVDEETVNTGQDKEGLVIVSLSPGKHTVRVEAQPTPVMRVGRFVSLLSLVILLGLGIWPRLHVNQKSSR